MKRDRLTCADALRACVGTQVMRSSTESCKHLGDEVRTLRNLYLKITSGAVHGTFSGVREPGWWSQQRSGVEGRRPGDVRLPA